MRNHEIVVMPEGWLSRGEAVVHGDGRQLAIFGGIPGERARVRITSERAREVRGRFIGPAGDKHAWRVMPPCEKWASCGRCRLMHVAPEGQRAMRAQLWKEAFGELQVTPREVGDAGAADALYALTLLAGRSDEGRARLGMAGALGGIIPVPACPVTTPELRMFMTAAAHHMLEQGLRPFDGRGGSFRGIVVREALSTGEAIATLVFAKPVPFSRPYADSLGQARAALVGICAHWNDEPHGDMVDASLAITPVLGRPIFEDHFGALRFRLGGLDPWYDTVAAREADLAVPELLGVTSGDAVVDIGCGAGARTLALVKVSGWGVGLDTREGVLERARDNASLNNVPAEFVAGEALSEALATVASRLEGRRPLVVVDTGTKGLDKDLGAALAALAPRRVLVLGSNPRALARDAKAWVGEGYRLRSVTCYDVDPHTPFSRGAALLESNDTSAPTLRAPRRTIVR